MPLIFFPARKPEGVGVRGKGKVAFSYALRREASAVHGFPFPGNRLDKFGVGERSGGTKTTVEGQKDLLRLRGTPCRNRTYNGPLGGGCYIHLTKEAYGNVQGRL